VFGKDYRQYCDTTHGHVHSDCNVISCKLKIENMVYREQRLHGKFGVVWKKAGTAVAQVLCYKSEGRWFDPS